MPEKIGMSDLTIPLQTTLHETDNGDWAVNWPLIATILFQKEYARLRTEMAYMKTLSDPWLGAPARALHVDLRKARSEAHECSVKTLRGYLRDIDATMTFNIFKDQLAAELSEYILHSRAWEKKNREAIRSQKQTIDSAVAFGEAGVAISKLIANTSANILMWASPVGKLGLVFKGAGSLIKGGTHYASQKDGDRSAMLSLGYGGSQFLLSLMPINSGKSIIAAAGASGSVEAGFTYVNGRDLREAALAGGISFFMTLIGAKLGEKIDLKATSQYKVSTGTRGIPGATGKAGEFKEAGSYVIKNIPKHLDEFILLLAPASTEAAGQMLNSYAATFTPTVVHKRQPRGRGKRMFGTFSGDPTKALASNSIERDLEKLARWNGELQLKSPGETPREIVKNCLTDSNIRYACQSGYARLLDAAIERVR